MKFLRYFHSVKSLGKTSLHTYKHLVSFLSNFYMLASVRLLNVVKRKQFNPNIGNFAHYLISSPPVGTNTELLILGDYYSYMMIIFLTNIV